MKKLLVSILLPTLALYLLAATPASALTLDNGHIDMFHVTVRGGQPELNLREDVTGSKREHDPASVQIVLPARAYTEATRNIGGIEAPAWVSPQSQVRGIPWLGWETSSTGAPTQLKFHSVSGPGSVYLFGENATKILQFLNTGISLRSGSVLTQNRPAHVHATWAFTKPGQYHFRVAACLEAKCSTTQTYSVEVQGHDNGRAPANKTRPKASQGQPQKTNQPAKTAPKTNQVDLPLNTHVHPNWVFTKPGEYRVKIRQDATLKSGQTVSDTTELTFQVGRPGNAKDGHFDLGLQLDGKAAVARIRDDRSAPGVWRAAKDLVFELGDAAHTKAPAGLEFIAAKDSELWMIGATQVANVPWLGANTQDPNLLAAAVGDVRWTLVSLTGPGGFAVFTQGNFGQPVDQLWFTAGEIAQPLAETGSGDGSSGSAVSSEPKPIASASADDLLPGIAAGVCLIGLLTLGYAGYRNRRP